MESSQEPVASSEMNQQELTRLIGFLNQSIIPKLRKLEHEIDILKQQVRRKKIKNWIEYDDPDL